MTFRSSPTFLGKSRYDERTGNWDDGMPHKVKHLDIRTRQEVFSDNTVEKYGRNYLSVRAQKPFPLDEYMVWNHKKWKSIDHNYLIVGDNRNRKWYSARFIEVGGYEYGN